MESDDDGGLDSLSEPTYRELCRELNRMFEDTKAKNRDLKMNLHLLHQQRRHDKARIAKLTNIIDKIEQTKSKSVEE